MKTVITYLSDGSTSQDNLNTITANLKHKFSFPIKSTLICTATKEDGMARYKYRAEISATCNEEQKQQLYKEVKGYASHALLI